MDEIYHYGIKGMRWGVRKSEPSNPGYSSKQRKQDRSLYGKGAERRINKRMNNGVSLLGARHYEVVRKNRIEKGKRITKKVLKGVGGLSITLGGAYLSRKILGPRAATPISEGLDMLSRKIRGKGLYDD